MNEIKFSTKVVVSQYLKRLKKEEWKKPPLHQRRIPRNKDFAEFAGVSLSAYYRWSGNVEAGINRRLTGAVIGLLRHHRFETDFNDIFEIVIEKEEGRGK